MPKPPSKLLLTDIVIDPTLSVRAVDERVAEEYADHLRSLPPIIVWYLEGRYVLVDGRHRRRAYEIAGAEEIPVIVMGGSREAAQMYLAQCDAHIGLRRSRAAKRIAIRLVLSTSHGSAWSDRRIATHTGTSHTLVAQVRAELASGEPDVSPQGGNLATQVLTETESQKSEPVPDVDGKIATRTPTETEFPDIQHEHDPTNKIVLQAQSHGDEAQEQLEPDGATFAWNESSAVLDSGLTHSKGCNLASFRGQGNEEEPPGADGGETLSGKDAEWGDNELHLLEDTGDGLTAASVVLLAGRVLSCCRYDHERRGLLEHLLDTFSAMLTDLDNTDTPDEEDESVEVDLDI